MAKKKFSEMSEHEKSMQGAAMLMEDWFNGELPEKTPANEKFGYVVLKFNFFNKGDEQMHYVSNANRDDMVKALQELLDNLKYDQAIRVKDQN